MGGDDLADDFQWDRPVRGEGGGSDEDTNGVNSTTASKRRTNRNDDDDDDETDAAGPPSSKKAKGSSSSAAETTTTRALPSSSPSLVLLQAGKDLFLQSPIECATFLTTAVQHYSMMMTMTEEASTLTTTNHDDTNDSDHETTVQKPDNNNNTDKAVNFLSVPVVAQFCLGPLPSSSSQKNDENDADHSLLLRCIRHAISMKKMKQWKTVASPCVLIVCLSARRAVSILKELAVLKVRVGKFFPKNGSVSEQRNLLASTPLGLAVGTPHRLHQLLCPPSSSCSTPSHAKSSPNKQHQQQKLSLGQTRLVIFDCHVSHKQYTVCTLPDTAPHCMALVRDGLGPQWSKSRNSKNNREDCCRVAFA